MNTELLYDEKELLNQVAQGQEAAFRKLFQHWQPVLASYIFRITRSKDTASEIVQDVFLKIWISREALAEVENFRNYLLIVSRNHAINSLRKTMREMQQLKLWTIENTTQDKDFVVNAYSGEETADERIYTLIDEAIESLPPRQKEVFVLHRYDRFTYLQIAEKLGIGRESVKTHLGLAVRAISKYLGQKAGLFFLLAVEIKKIF